MNPRHMTFAQRPGVWRTFSDNDIEFNLGGDVAAPYPANIEMAEACEAQLASVQSKALAYLSKLIDPSAAVSGELELEWIDFGLSNYGEHNEFEVFFSDAATYVLWAVRFGYRRDSQTNVSSLSPRGFSRRSW